MIPLTMLSLDTDETVRKLSIEFSVARLFIFGNPSFSTNNVSLVSPIFKLRIQSILYNYRLDRPAIWEPNLKIGETNDTLFVENEGLPKMNKRATENSILNFLTDLISLSNLISIF
jgi:hypothetical protein